MGGAIFVQDGNLVTLNTTFSGNQTATDSRGVLVTGGFSDDRANVNGESEGEAVGSDVFVYQSSAPAPGEPSPFLFDLPGSNSTGGFNDDTDTRLTGDAGVGTEFIFPRASISLVQDVTEGSGVEGIINVTLDRVLPFSVFVPVTLSTTDATQGDDFVVKDQNDNAVTGTEFFVQIDAGSTQGQFRVEAPDDDDPEPDGETVTFEIDRSDDLNYFSLGATTSTDLAIADDGDVGVDIQETLGVTAVAEGDLGDGVQFQLIIQPTDDVTLNFTTPGDLSPVDPITFTPANWDQPQTVRFKAPIDGVDEGVENVQVQLGVTSTDTRYSSLAIDPIDVEVREALSGGEGLASGLESSFRVLEQSISDNLSNVLFPIIGSIENEIPDFIGTFQASLSAALTEIDDAGNAAVLNTAQTLVKNAVEQAFTDQGLPSPTVNVVLGVDPGDAGTTLFEIDIAQSYDLGAKDLDRSLGLLGVGLGLGGNAQLDMVYDLSLSGGIGNGIGGEFFLDADASNLAVDIVSEDPTGFSGRLGFVPLDLTDHTEDPTEGLSPTKLDADFTIDFTDPDGSAADGDRLTLDEINNTTNIADISETLLKGEAHVGLDAEADFAAAAIPRFLFDLEIDWGDFEIGEGEFGDRIVADNLAFNDLEVDFGSFAENFLAPVLNTIDDVVDPVRPLLNFLNREIGLFSTLEATDLRLRNRTLDENGNGRVTVAELLAWLGGTPISPKLLEALEDITELSATVEQIAAQPDSGFLIPLGSFDVTPEPPSTGIRPSVPPVSTFTDEVKLTNPPKSSDKKPSTVEGKAVTSIGNSDLFSFPIIEQGESQA
ncbi:MAG: hypothetical protein AAGA67_00580 [Cyanobacteria bacterium P01_F01_bin.153]